LPVFVATSFVDGLITISRERFANRITIC